jgi:hypothetical protein
MWLHSTICNYFVTAFTTVITNDQSINGKDSFSNAIKKSVKNILIWYYMSTQTTPPQMPLYPGYPYGYDNSISVQEQILAAVTGNAEQTKQQAANDIARDIVRAVENNGHINASTTERTSAQIAAAVERNGAFNASTTERVNSQLATAVERNGANNQAAIERTSGEARLTTVIESAAGRQASNDSIRDVLRAVDRAGLENVTASKDGYNGLLASVERNAGEGRIQTLTSSGIIDNSLRDVRYSILSDVNRVGNDLNASGVQNYNALSKSVTDGAWEARSSMANGFQNLAEEHLRTKFDLMKGQECHYASLMLEQQKLGQFITSKADNHFAMNQLEMQKVKEGLAAQASHNFASNQLETQKVKEALAAQAAQNFASNQLETLKAFASAQLEAQKNREAIQMDAQRNREAIQQQLCDAKYEALKSQQFLADKIDECCCSVKEKMDSIDRDNLRDNLDIARDKNAIQDGINFQQLLLGRAGPLGGYGPGPWGGYGPGFDGYGPGYGPVPAFGVNVDVGDHGHRHHDRHHHDRRRGGDGRR